MKKGWRVILSIVVVVVILGGVCVGVGLLTGADIERINQNLNEHFQLNAYVEAYTDYARQLWQWITAPVT
ncbi:MAG: hypothetical protein K6C08_09785 [Oscillospiraceae bacterium]|nr:hypothetical protein [Oscillospiraceae bacterium]